MCCIRAPFVRYFRIVSTDIIHGKLDQRNSHLEVDYAIGRDIQWNNVGNISATLQEWCDSCETVLSCIEKQIERANLEKARRTKHKETIEQEVSSDCHAVLVFELFRLIFV